MSQYRSRSRLNERLAASCETEEEEIVSIPLSQ